MQHNTLFFEEYLSFILTVLLFFCRFINRIFLLRNRITHNLYRHKKKKKEKDIATIISQEDFFTDFYFLCRIHVLFETTMIHYVHFDVHKLIWRYKKIKNSIYI